MFLKKYAKMNIPAPRKNQEHEGKQKAILPPRAVTESEYPPENVCCYCGTVMKHPGGCAEDYGLHTPYIENFYALRVCGHCDLTITQTNRILKHLLDGRGHIDLLKAHMEDVYRCLESK